MLRSIAHELIHHWQNEEGRLDVGGYSGPGYYLKNKDLKKLEDEAMLLGNGYFREFEDNLKLKEKKEMSLNEWKNNELNKLLMKKFGILKEEKEITHMCALEVTHKASGKKGHPIRHTLNESGDISHYTVEFENVIVENIAVENLDIIVQEEHSHKRDDEKDHDKKKPVVEEEELEEENKMPMKTDTEDLDGDGDTKDKVPAFLDKGDKGADSKKDKEESDEDKGGKDLSKVPPQLRDHVKGKMKQESIEELVKENRKLRLRIK